MPLLNLFRRRSTRANGPAVRWWRGSSSQADDGDGQPQDPRLGTRRWTAGETNRLNEAQWANAAGSSINEDLSAKLETLRQRCSVELGRNPILAGMVDTYVAHLVGPDGPQLQVLSQDTPYNDALEAVWNRWWGGHDSYVDPEAVKPDLAGLLWGPDILDVWVRNLFDCGEYLAQVTVEDNPARGTIQTRLNLLDPRRLATSIAATADQNVFMGVEVDRYGRPIRYHVEKAIRYGALMAHTGETEPLDPRDVIHRYRVLEAGQLRGVPWLAASLQPAADLRSYDDEVLDAARQAASMGVTWYTDHPDAPFMEVNESRTVQRQTEWTGPPGWKPMFATPGQPSAQYVDYRRERLADLARPISMPLMILRLTAENHNYSSARMDVQIWGMSIRKAQSWIARHDLSRLVSTVGREAELAALVPARPKSVTYQWIWPKMPHVDPEKERKAERLGLENGPLSFADACAANGTDEDTVIAKWQRTNQKLEAAGMEPLPSPMAYLKQVTAVKASDSGAGPGAGRTAGPTTAAKPNGRERVMA